MATDVSVLARRRPTTLARRFRAYTLAPGARRDRMVFAVALGASLCFILAILSWPGRFPTVSLTPLILLSGLYLPKRPLIALYLVIGVGVAFATPRLPITGPTKIVMLTAIGALMVMMVVVASSRTRVGSTGFHGENLLVELRDRMALRMGAARAPRATTFHSFCYALVRAHQDSDLFVEPMRLLSGPEQDVTVRELLAGQPDLERLGLAHVRWPDELRACLTTRGFADEVRAVLARSRELGLGPDALDAFAARAGRRGGRSR